MTSHRFGFAALTLIVMVALGGTACAQRQIDRELNTLRLPPGFAIEVFARVPSARSIAVAGETGAIYVGSRGHKVHVVIDRRSENKPNETRLALQFLQVPNGIVWHDGRLYIAEQPKISVYDASDPTRATPKPIGDIKTGLPDKSHHGWRYLGHGPDDKLYVALGVACNICQAPLPEGTIMRLDRDGGNVEIVASGVRNSVGLDFHPLTGDLFFTDNGADNLGDNVPADELNHLTRPGQHFGFPYFAGGNTRSPRYRDQTPPGPVVPPVIEFGAHHAALGIHFYRGGMFPADYVGDAFVAQHGSWNRTDPAGYRVMRVRFDKAGKAVGKEVFIDGWLQADGSAWGRPVDLKTLPDGSLLISDDRADVLYRVSYRK